MEKFETGSKFQIL